MAGLYIHIPFCESRCIYCGFYSTTSLKLRDDYTDALCREMQMRPAKAALGSNETIETIYLGGGTPSQLNGSQLNQIFSAIRKNYTLAENMEITMECNPDDVTGDFCETLKQLPINRISMGAQTFCNERLRFLHRRHNAGEVEEAVTRLRNIGIRNISIDLMFGFPEESLLQSGSRSTHASASCLSLPPSVLPGGKYIHLHARSRYTHKWYQYQVCLKALSRSGTVFPRQVSLRI